MAFEKITENVENISLLPDNPALTSSELKKEFDKAGKIIKEKFNKLIDELNNNMYPIGTGFIAYDDTDYTNHLGFKWEKTLIGKTPVGKDVDDNDFNTIGKTGGEKKHTLIQSELPESMANGWRGSGNIGWGGLLGVANCDGVIAAQNNTTHGENKPHNNLQPYQIVNFWKRTS